MSKVDSEGNIEIKKSNLTKEDVDNLGTEILQAEALANEAKDDVVKLRAEHKVLIDGNASDIVLANDEITVTQGLINDVDKKLEDHKLDFNDLMHEVDGNFLNKQDKLDARARTVLGVDEDGKTSITETDNPKYVLPFTLLDKEVYDIASDNAQHVTKAKVVKAGKTETTVPFMNGEGVTDFDKDDAKLVTKAYVDDLETILEATKADAPKNMLTAKDGDVLTLKVTPASGSVKEKREFVLKEAKGGGDEVKYVEINSGYVKDHISKIKDAKLQMGRALLTDHITTGTVKS